MVWQRPTSRGPEHYARKPEPAFSKALRKSLLDY